MLSHEIHASIVLRILKFPNNEVFTLKTNSLQLLLEKTPNFATDLSKERHEQMSQTFGPLVEEATKFLKLKTTEKDLAKAAEK